MSRMDGLQAAYDNWDFRDRNEEKTYPVKNPLPIAYTELGTKNQFPVEVSFDLNTEEYIYDVNGEKYRQKSSIEQLKGDLCGCNFDDFIRDAYDYLEKQGHEEEL